MTYVKHSKYFTNYQKKTYYFLEKDQPKKLNYFCVYHQQNKNKIKILFT